MGWTARHLLLVTTTVLLSTVAGVDPFNLPPLDCARINVAFCCTSRIRALCPTECQGVPCGPSFYHTLFSTDGDTNGLVVGAGQQPAPEWSFQNGRFREQQNGGNPLAIPGTVSNNKEGDATILTPSEAKPFESATTILPALGSTKSPYFSGVVTSFPTLIPDLAQSTLGGGASTPLDPAHFWFLDVGFMVRARTTPNPYYPTPSSSSPAPSSQVMYVKELGGEKPDLAEFGIPAAVAAGVSTVQPMRQLATTTTAAVPQRTTGKPRRRTTPDPRIIKPPRELVIISEYDEDAPPESQPASVIPSMGGASATAPPLHTSTVATASAAPTATTESVPSHSVLSILSRSFERRACYNSLSFLCDECVVPSAQRAFLLPANPLSRRTVVAIYPHARRFAPSASVPRLRLADTTHRPPARGSRARGAVAARFRTARPRPQPSPARFREVRSRRFFIDKSVIDDDSEVIDNVVETSIDRYRTTDVLIPFGNPEVTVAPVTTLDPEVDLFFATEAPDTFKRSIVPAEFFSPMGNNTSGFSTKYSSRIVEKNRFIDSSSTRVIVDGGRKRVDGNSFGNSYGISRQLRLDKEWARKKRIILERIAKKKQKWHANVLPHGTDSVGLGPRKEGPEKRIKIFAVDGSTIGRSRGSSRRVQHSVDEASQFAEKPQIAEKPSTMHNRTNSFFLPLSFNFRPKTNAKTDQISPSVAGNGPNVDTAAVIPPQFIPQTIRPLFQTAAPTTLPPTTTTRRSHLIPISPIITQPSPPNPTGQCGVAPDFVPCLSAAQASKSLLRCCQAKGLPPGCQDLCRYDITQAEVKAAMDAGRCGLLSVQPYLECASQGKDNTECCQYRGIAQKSGPQCIDLCRPHPLHPLGLQHIVCGSVIKDLLQCHHSGVRE
ncbi:hypothetical protein PRIPAC_82457 [Pristionchus pacificus]|uniref:DB domain-containing protein n=1 Tax=Pristionchus pacificus TaxID=54126 RepID=A0A2A6BXY8_PRIPA|nr:hypothetical protein PRIPAC_82457 [Pristionchus pacificus]|eukprot:PDM70716.1 hypothetical protein PRIPAC_44920 [Pristionchus pacificus]